ncbi:MAG: UDP-N-acetylmuramoyl-tripeptide--D-alanyl-D-alanine ligase [Bacteroidetes bacterium]|nr:UDP-N-acetylmuramoyl-tripeptide--D-alanyl-D-alanine ligase [Bacteroidota bacterium]MBL6943966.1 UDP-N-acetylmuramoyl-tripeptide--D-alanyl-D-alanine ligase [Bacteroidales bacterium]
MKIIKELYHHFILSEGVSTDSREDVANKIFFALSGDNFNGNKFADDALNKGAKLCVIDDPSFATDSKCILVNNVLLALQELAKHHREKNSATVLAITGSNGKTTTKELISSVLGNYIDIISTQGNYNNHIGVPLTLLNIKPNTNIAVVEMGANHIGEIDKLCEIANPDVGIITNIGKAHLEGFGSFESVICAKNELYNYLKKNKGTVIVNNDDELLKKLAIELPQFSYGKNNSDVEGEVVEYNPSLKIKWTYNNNVFECTSQLYGKYNFDNIMAAIAVGLFFNVSEQSINQSIETFVPGNNRSQQIKTKYNSIFLDAYNANPTSMNEAVMSFAGNNFAMPWLILGDMFELGSYSKNEHQLIVDLINKTGFKNVILVGSDFNQTLEHNFMKFITTDDAKSYLIVNKIKNANILIKGSRRMELEKLIDLL